MLITQNSSKNPECKLEYDGNGYLLDEENWKLIPYIHYYVKDANAEPCNALYKCGFRYPNNDNYWDYFLRRGGPNDKTCLMGVSDSKLTVLGDVVDMSFLTIENEKTLVLTSKHELSAFFAAVRSDKKPTQIVESCGSIYDTEFKGVLIYHNKECLCITDSVNSNTNYKIAEITRMAKKCELDDYDESNAFLGPVLVFLLEVERFLMLKTSQFFFLKYFSYFSILFVLCCILFNHFCTARSCCPEVLLQITRVVMCTSVETLVCACVYS